MITAAHAIIYSDDAAATRAFFRDVLELPNVDVHDGWLIFKLPPAELGIHPSGEGVEMPHHELFLMCDDVRATVVDLEAKGVVFTSEIEDQSFGLIISMHVPGGGTVGLYQPKHATGYDLPG
jgi:catechol 2,3-dioxygenase-like lactoylglutathione lyase family enzyme